MEGDTRGLSDDTQRGALSLLSLPLSPLSPSLSPLPPLSSLAEMYTSYIGHESSEIEHQAKEGTSHDDHIGTLASSTVARP